MTSGWGFPRKFGPIKWECQTSHSLTLYGHSTLNLFNWPFRSRSILHRATFHKFQSPVTLDLCQGYTVMDHSLTSIYIPSSTSIAQYLFDKMDWHFADLTELPSFGVTWLSLWDEIENSASIMPWGESRRHTESPIIFIWPCRSLSICRGTIFHNFPNTILSCRIGYSQFFSHFIIARFLYLS